MVRRAGVHCCVKALLSNPVHRCRDHERVDVAGLGGGEGEDLNACIR